jgi:hypothetical protein
MLSRLEIYVCKHHISDDSTEILASLTILAPQAGARLAQSILRPCIHLVGLCGLMFGKYPTRISDGSSATLAEVLFCSCKALQATALYFHM